MKALKRAARFFSDISHVWFDWHSGFHREEDQLLKTYYKNADAVMAVMGRRGSKARKNYDHAAYGDIKQGVVVKVDGRITHGGLSDRLRGVCAIYDLCKSENIPFYLSFTYPFNLENYLEPNTYNWKISPADVVDDAYVSQPVLLTLGVFMSRKFQLPYLRCRWRHDHAKQLHVYSNSTSADKHFKTVFSELFRPTARLQQSIDDVLSAIGGDFVGCVFRFQQLLGDFKEGDYDVLPPQERQTLIDRCIAKVEELRERLLGNDARYILVTSDSVTFLDAISKGRDYIRTIPGKVVHIDYTTDANYEVYEKSFVDLLVLSRAKRISLFKTGKMYHSGFAHRAALISGADYDEIIF